MNPTDLNPAGVPFNPMTAPATPPAPGVAPPATTIPHGVTWRWTADGLTQLTF